MMISCKSVLLQTDYFSTYADIKTNRRLADNKNITIFSSECTSVKSLRKIVMSKKVLI